MTWVGVSARFVRVNVIGSDVFSECHYSEKELNRTGGKICVVKDADVLHLLANS